MRTNRIVRWFLAPLSLLAVLFLTVRSQIVERPVARLLETGLEIVTGEQVVIGSLSIEPLSRQADVIGLIVSHADGEGNRTPVVAAERVSVQFGVPGMGAWIQRLKIERPVVHLHVDEDGLREFRNVDAGGEASDGLPWEQIEVENARFEIETAMGSVLVEGADVRTTQRDEVDVRVESLHIRFPGVDESAHRLSWQNVRLTPGQLTIPDLRVESQHVRLQGDLDAEFGGALRGAMTASVALPILDGLKHGTFQGTGHLDIELGGTVRDPKLAGAVLVSDVVFEDSSDKVIRLDRLLAQMEWQGHQLNVLESESQWAKGTLFTEGQIDLMTSNIRLSTNFESIDLRSAIREAGGHPNSWTTFSGDGDIQAMGTLRPFQLNGAYDIAVQDLDVRSGPPEDETAASILRMPTIELKGNLEVDTNGIWLRSERARSGATSGSIDAFIGFQSHGPLDIEYDFDRASLSSFRPLQNLDLWGFGRLFGTVKGPFKDIRLTAGARIRDFRMLGAQLADKITTEVVCRDLKTLEFRRFTGQLGATNYLGHADVTMGDMTTIDVGIEVVEGRVEDLMRIGGDAIPGVTGRISGIVNLNGDPQSLGGDFDAELRDVYLLGEQFPAGRLSGWISDAVVHLDGLSLERWNGEESVLTRGSIDMDWNANLDVTAAGFRLDRLNHLQRMGLPMRGWLSIDALIEGKLLDPQPQGRLALRNATYGNFPIPDSTIRFQTESESIQLQGNLVGSGLQFDGNIERAETRDYRIDVSLQEFPLHSVYPVGADGADIRALLTGQVNLKGRLNDSPTLDIAGQGRTLTLQWDRHQLHSLAPWSFELSGQAMALEGLRVQGAGTDLQWDLNTDADGNLSGTGGGVVDADLARMWVEGLERADGSVAVNINVDGRLDEAQWTIDAATCGLTIQGDWFPHPLESLEGVLRIGADGAYVRALDVEGGLDAREEEWLERSEMLQPCMQTLSRPGMVGRLGDGSVQIEGGFKAKDWWPELYDLDAEIRNARVQYLEELPHMVASASFQLDGPVDELLLSGNVDVTEMIFSDRISWEEWLLELTESESSSLDMEVEEPLFAMDIALVSDNTIRMRNNVADFVAGGELRIVGDTNEPGLLGSLRATPEGRVYLKEREFEVQRGEIHFVDPFTYDPDLDLMLLTDVRSREDEYEVTYRVSGTYEDWRAETRSEPSLPAADVNALLLFGMTRAEMERYGGLGGALAVEGGDILASSFLFSGRGDGERGGLFRIVDPLRPERLDLVSGVSERGSGAVSSDLRLLYENDLSDVGLAGSLMIFEQNISRSSDTYLGFEQRLARKLFARTYWGSEQVGRYLDIGGAYGVEMKVRWELD